MLQPPESIKLPDSHTAAQNLRNWAAADPALAKLLATESSPAYALGRWGTRLMLLKNIPQAIAALGSAAALGPSDPLVWTNLGIVLDQAHALPEAAACFEYSLALSPAQLDTWLLLGTVQRKRGNLMEAQAACVRALELKPNSLLGWQCLGLVKQDQRDYGAAIQCYEKYLQHGGPDGGILANLGRLYAQTGRFGDSWRAYQQAVQLDPTKPHYQRMLRQTRFIKDVLEGAPVDEAAMTFRQAADATDPNAQKELADIFDHAFGMLSGFGHTQAAIHVGKGRQELWPSHTAEYLLRAVAGDQTLARSPAEYVAEHFDEFAEGFDAALVGELGYDIPAKLAAAVQGAVTPGPVHAVLDAGCGTGLCGPCLRPLARKLTGVDLSAKMLQQAQRRGCYDELVHEDLIAYLARSPAAFDLIAAADLVIYLGDLVPLFADAAAALRPGGVLALSTEAIDGDGYRLLPSGRFAHGPEYVRAVAQEAFTPCAAIDTTIRLEATRPVKGNIFVYRRR